jgi:preprotein translocase subunit SecD
MGRQRWLLFVIAALVAASIYVLTTVPLQLGLDLRGGSQLTIQVKPPESGKAITSQDLKDVKGVIENRINALGVSEPLVEIAEQQNQVIVQLPGVDDPKQAERVLGGTAQLEFRALRAGDEGKFAAFSNVLAGQQQERTQLLEAEDRAATQAEKDALQPKIDANKASIKTSSDEIIKLFEPAGITGKNLTGAYAADQGASNWSVAIQFDQAGGDKFAEITKQVAGTGRPLGIFLDNELVSSPVVDAKDKATGIVGGQAIITGRFGAKEANELAIQLKSGSLPFPIEIVENRTVGASLGQESIQRSIWAGLGGLFLVFVFMIVYYRLPGVIASIALLIYALLNIAVFDILNVTLTLPGIAGFILSIGMAVDANVLIFERTREELQAGNTLYKSVQAGFFRAFSSILDGNVTTVIACLALFFLGAGLVKGFALTLMIGVMISMFTALTCSRTFLMYVLTIPSLRKPEWFAPGLKATKSSEAA